LVGWPVAQECLRLLLIHLWVLRWGVAVGGDESGIARTWPVPVSLTPKCYSSP
jgi:hypothetical protein